MCLKQQNKEINNMGLMNWVQFIFIRLYLVIGDASDCEIFLFVHIACSVALFVSFGKC